MSFLKRCLRCRKNKPLEKFPKRAGTVYRGRTCDTCVASGRTERTHYDKKGLTEKEYLALIAHQDGKCAVCKLAFEDTPHIDHCHKTRRVRGLLCGKCNPALGLLKDDIERLEAAIKYLQEKGTPGIAYPIYL